MGCRIRRWLVVQPWVARPRAIGKVVRPIPVMLLGLNSNRQAAPEPVSGFWGGLPNVWIGFGRGGPGALWVMSALLDVRGIPTGRTHRSAPTRAHGSTIQIGRA